ncbi:hypothetical protein LB505_014071 [Fusarium chuoi]|nr:hypothetical protein LB505_014071 [Fusarium chuoi]
MFSPFIAELFVATFEESSYNWELECVFGSDLAPVTVLILQQQQAPEPRSHWRGGEDKQQSRVFNDRWESRSK